MTIKLQYEGHITINMDVDADQVGSKQKLKENLSAMNEIVTNIIKKDMDGVGDCIKYDLNVELLNLKMQEVPK